MWSILDSHFSSLPLKPCSKQHLTGVLYSRPVVITTIIGKSTRPKGPFRVMFTFCSLPHGSLFFLHPASFLLPPWVTASLHSFCFLASSPTASLSRLLIVWQSYQLNEGASAIVVVKIRVAFIYLRQTNIHNKQYKRSVLVSFSFPSSLPFTICIGFVVIVFFSSCIFWLMRVPAPYIVHLARLHIIN